MTAATPAAERPGVERPPAVAPREDVAAQEGYFSPMLDVDVRLNANEAPEAPPQAFLDALAAGVAGIEFNRYPDREAVALRAAIGEVHGVGPESIYCANGSNEVLQSLFLAYGGPRRAAALFEPTYAMHSQIARVTGTAVVAGRRDRHFLIEEGELNRVLDEASASHGATNPVLTFICSPNNPTGRVEPPSLVHAALRRAPGLVVVDEAYGQFAPSSALEIEGEHPNLVVIRTFSKTWSLAALRLGYAVAAPEVVRALFAVTLPYHLDAMKQLAGRLALEYSDAMQERTRRLVAERQRVVRALAGMAVEVVPSDANFVLFRVENKDAKQVWKELVDRSVLVRDISTIPHLDGYLRVTIGTPEEDDAFLAALGAALT